MPVPVGAVENGPTRAFLAVLAGGRSIRAVASLCGWSPSTAYQHLTVARHCGLVAWEPGRHGTLRPLLDSTQIRRRRLT